MVRPLRQMAAATRAFGEGDFIVRGPVEGKDEVAELAAALNSMAVSLSSVEGMRPGSYTHLGKAPYTKALPLFKQLTISARMTGSRASHESVSYTHLGRPCAADGHGIGAELVGGEMCIRDSS